MKKQHIVAITCLSALFGSFSTIVDAFEPMQAKPVPKRATIQASGMPKPPTCPSGFTVINKQLSTTSGNDKYWLYGCAKQVPVNMICNSGLSPTDLNVNVGSSQGIEGGSKKTVYISYNCYKPVG